MQPWSINRNKPFHELSSPMEGETYKVVDSEIADTRV